MKVNPVARIPWATSTTQIEIVQCWWPEESVLRGSLQFRTLKVRILKVLTLCESAKVKQRYLYGTGSSNLVHWMSLLQTPEQNILKIFMISHSREKISPSYYWQKRLRCRAGGRSNTRSTVESRNRVGGSKSLRPGLQSAGGFEAATVAAASN